MKLLKMVTLTKQTCSAVLLLFQVTKVTVEVTVKSIDRDIIYYIVTLVTLLLTYTYTRARARTHEGVLNFSGNRGNRTKKQDAELKNPVTFAVTWLPQALPCYLKNAVTYGGI